MHKICRLPRTIVQTRPLHCAKAITQRQLMKHPSRAKRANAMPKMGINIDKLNRNGACQICNHFIQPHLYNRRGVHACNRKWTSSCMHICLHVWFVRFARMASCRSLTNATYLRVHMCVRVCVYACVCVRVCVLTCMWRM